METSSELQEVETPDALPRYDVYVRKPLWAEQRLLRERALGQQLMSVDKLEKLLEALQRMPKVRVGAEVESPKAQQVKQSFESVGFEVDLVPVLALQKKVAVVEDPREECPACGELVLVTPERQCPSCGVFVDKVTPEQRMRRKLMKEERDRLLRTHELGVQKESQRLRAKLEEELRKRIRAELEEELGLLRDQPSSSPQWLKAARVGIGMVALGATFAFGHWQGGLTTEKVLAGAKPLNLSFDRLISGVGPLAVASSALGDPANMGAVTLSPQDSPITAVQMAQSGGRANSLGKVIAEATGGTASGQTPGGVVSVAVEQRAQLAAEFIQMLARNGQVLRARDVWVTLKANAAYAASPQALAQLESVDWELRAWGVAAEALVKRRGLIEGLRTEISAITDPLRRTQALLQVGAALSQTPSLPAEVGAAFFNLAQESMATLTDLAQQEQARSDFMLSSAQVIWAESQARARAGAWTRVAELQSQLDGLIPKATNAVVATQLQALSIRNRVLQGQMSEATQVLVAALDAADKEPALVTRGRLLRYLAGVGDVAVRHERLQASLERLSAAAQDKVGPAQADIFLSLALIYADVGQKEAKDAAVKRAWSVPDLSPAQQTEISANALTQTEIATAQRLSQMRAYNQAEPHILQVTQYLLL